MKHPLVSSCGGGRCPQLGSLLHDREITLQPLQALLPMRSFPKCQWERQVHTMRGLQYRHEGIPQQLCHGHAILSLYPQPVSHEPGEDFADIASRQAGTSSVCPPQKPSVSSCPLDAHSRKQKASPRRSRPTSPPTQPHGHGGSCWILSAT